MPSTIELLAKMWVSKLDVKLSLFEYTHVRINYGVFSQVARSALFGLAQVQWLTGSPKDLMDFRSSRAA